MAKGLIGRKLGMSQTFDENGKLVPVTVLRAGPCAVTQLKTQDKDQYVAMQVGFESAKEKHLSKARQGHFTKKNVPMHRILREFRDPEIEELEVGKILKADIFATGDKVKITGVSKGKGFAGVHKRHGFGGGRASHGSHFHRAPGSMGASAYPSRVFKGKKLPGHHGTLKVSALSVPVVSVDAERNIIMVKGPIPGPRNSLVKIEAMKS